MKEKGWRCPFENGPDSCPNSVRITYLNNTSPKCRIKIHQVMQYSGRHGEFPTDIIDAVPDNCPKFNKRAMENIKEWKRTKYYLKQPHTSADTFF